MVVGFALVVGLALVCPFILDYNKIVIMQFKMSLPKNMVQVCLVSVIGSVLHQ